MLLTNTIQNVTTTFQIILDCVAGVLRVRPVASAYFAVAAMRSMRTPNSRWQSILPQRQHDLHLSKTKRGSNRDSRFEMSVDINRCFCICGCSTQTG
jgi:hypothetical protein